MKMRRARRWRGRCLGAVSAAAVVASMGASARVARALDWDPDAATPGVQGGAGTWSASATNFNWNDGTASNVSWVNGSAAVFAGTGGAVTLDATAGAIDASTLRFDSAGYVLSGDTLTLSGGTITANANAQILGPINATAGLTKMGSGILLLAGVNTISGTAAVNEGVLRIEADGALGGGSVAVASGAQLLLNSDYAALPAVQSSGNVTVASGRSVVSTGGFTLDAGTLNLNGGFRLNGGTFAYNGGNINGQVVVSNGTVSLGAAAGSGSFLFNQTGGAVGVIPAGMDVLLQQGSAGAPSVNFVSSGSLTNNGTITASSLQAGGIVTMNFNGGLLNNGTFTVNPGASANGTRSFSGIITNSSSGLININASMATAGPNQIQNSGVVNIAPFQTLSLGTFGQNGGTLNVGGTLTAGTFTYTGGQISGVVNVGGSISPGLLNLQTSPGGGTFILQNGGTISGNIPGNTTVTVAPVSTFATSNSLTLTGGAPWTNNGTLILSSLNANSSLTVNSAISNNGTLTVSPGPTSDGMRSFAGSITNLGLININATTVGVTLTNSGTVNVAATKNFNPSGIVHNSGLLNVAGTITTPTFIYNGGQVSGTVQVGGSSFSTQSSLTLGTSAGGGTFLMVPTTTSNLTGNIPANMTLIVQPSGTFPTTATLFAIGGPPGGPITNSGTLILSSLNANHTLGVSGSITNNGTITVNPGPTGEGVRTFGGSITNSGNININASTQVFLSLSNSGSISVGPGRALSVSGPMFMTSGNLSAPSGNVTATSFSYTGGQINGTVTVSSFSSPALTLGPSAGAGSFIVIPNTSATIFGSIASNMTLSIQPTFSTFPQTTSVTMQSTTGGPMANNGQLVLSSVNANHSITVNGPGMTNAGTLTIDPGPSGDAARTLSMTLSTSGTMNVNASTSVLGLTNTGTINIGAGRILSLTQNPLTQTSGAINVNGTLTSRTTTINGGTVTIPASGTFTTGSLTYNGGTVSGVVIMPTPGSLSLTTLPASMQLLLQPSTAFVGTSYSMPSSSWSNNGTIAFATPMASSGINATGSGALTNNGTINFNAAGSQELGRTFGGTITNSSSGTINVNGAGSISTLTNSGAINVAALEQLGSNTFTQQAGTLALAGTLATANFNNVGGAITGGGTVALTGSGGATLGASGSPVNLWVRDESALSGNLGAGSSLLVASNSLATSTYTLTSAGNLTSSAPITLGSAASNAGVVLRLGTGSSTLTNNAVLTSNPGNSGGGLRQISGILANGVGGVFNVNTDTSVDHIQNLGAINIAPGKTLTVPGSLDDLVQNPGAAINVTPGATLDAGATLAGAADITLAPDAFTGGVFAVQGLRFSGSSGTGRVISTPGAGEVPGRMDLRQAVTPFNIADGSAAIDTEVPVPITGLGLIKTGPGTLRLSGNNSFTGTATAGGGTLLVAGNSSLGAATAKIGFNGGTLKLEGPVSGTRDVVLGAGGGTLDGGAFAVSVGNVDGSGNLTKIGGGTLTANHLRSGLLNITAGRAVVRASGGAAGMNVLADLSLGAGTALDVNDNDFAIGYSGASAFTTIKQLVLSGFHGAPTPGATGIVSTAGQNAGGQAIHALFDNGLVGATDWLGVTIPANSVVGKYTYFGDVNLDGQVSGDDYTIIDSNLNTTPAVGLEWMSGDANLDGMVTGDDYTTIDSNLGLGSSNPLAPSALAVSPLSMSAVPEPGGLAVVVLGGAVLVRRRRHSRTRA